MVAASPAADGNPKGDDAADARRCAKADAAAAGRAPRFADLEHVVAELNKAAVGIGPIGVAWS